MIKLFTYSPIIWISSLISYGLQESLTHWDDTNTLPLIALNLTQYLII